MTRACRQRLMLLSIPLLTLAPTASAALQQSAVKTSVAGAMPNDKAMTCDMIASERSAIDDAVAAKSASKQKSAKVKKGLFGFAKGIASVMVPGAAMGLGGGSMIGSLAAQGVGQSASQALAGSGSRAAPTPPVSQPSAEQQARLTRLANIAAYRQCAV